MKKQFNKNSILKAKLKKKAKSSVLVETKWNYLFIKYQTILDKY
jgi:hypothetical protein